MKFNKDITKIKRVTFFWDTVYIQYISQPGTLQSYRWCRPRDQGLGL